MFHFLLSFTLITHSVHVITSIVPPIFKHVRLLHVILTTVNDKTFSLNEEFVCTESMNIDFPAH